MKMIVVVFALVAVAIAAPPAAPQTAQVLRSEFNKQPNGAYLFGFETDNGISRQENGEVKETLDEEKKPHAVVVVRGSWTYTDPEGKVETINYFADENGYHAEGPSVPKVAGSRR